MNINKKVIIIFIITCFLTVLSKGKADLPAQEEQARRWADETLAGLSLEKKIGQMICGEISGAYIADADPRLEQWKRLARDYGVGGFVLYGGTPRDVAHLLNLLQKEAELPILMSVDFEGGPGQQVTGATEFPANMAFAAAGSEELTYEAASIGAVEGRAMGFHLTYTPVVDISIQPDNPAESVRSFGGDIDLLDRLVRAYVRGYRDNGMLTTAKHFPGRGGQEPLPGFSGFYFINKPGKEVEEQEFRAFKHAIDAGVAFIMSEHIAVPSVTDGSKLPASVEKKLATGWVRDKLGFKGILTTDDLWYAHVIDRFGPIEIALKAIEAGHDIILKPKDPIAAIQGIFDAVKSGRISEERINSSVRKLLYLKAGLNLHKNRFIDEEGVNAVVGTPEHLAKAQEVADRSLTMLKNEGVLPLQADGLNNVININIQKYDFDPAPAELTRKLTAAIPSQNFNLRPDTDPNIMHKIRRAAADSDLVILSLFVQRDRAGDPAPLRTNDLEFINMIISTRPKAVIAMAYGNPHLIRKIEKVPVFLVGYGEGGWYGNQTIYFDTFIKLLKGELKPTGKLPVKVSDKFPIGSGLSY